MENFKAYPSDMLTEASQLSSLSRQLLLSQETLQKVYATMQSVLKEAVGQEFRQALQGFSEQQIYFDKQCSVLRQVAKIYAEAECRCLDLNQQIGESVAITNTAASTPLRRGAVFNRDLILDDWLAELVYTDQIRGGNGNE